CPTSAPARSSTGSRSASAAAQTSPFPPTTQAWIHGMSARSRRGSGRVFSCWLIALLVALIATVQIRSQAEVERSFAGADTASLAFLIDNLHRANDSLQAEITDLAQRQAKLQSGSDT